MKAEKKTSFDIKITNRDMYNFLMYHSYHSFTGGFSIAAGAALLAYDVWCRMQGSGSSVLYPFFGILFLIYQPWTLFISSAKQVTTNPVFSKPIHYELSENGITVSQDGQTTEIGWDGVFRIREGRRSILVYTGKKNACIWPKSQLGDQKETVKQLLADYASSAACGKKKKAGAEERNAQ